MKSFISFDYLSPKVNESDTGKNFPAFCGATLQFADGHLATLPAGNIVTQEYTGRSLMVFLNSNFFDPSKILKAYSGFMDNSTFITFSNILQY